MLAYILTITLTPLLPFTHSITGFHFITLLQLPLIWTAASYLWIISVFLLCIIYTLKRIPVVISTNLKLKAVQVLIAYIFRFL